MSVTEILLKSTLKQNLLKQKNITPVDMNRVAAIILGGGQGTRLFPLTETRCKPAISFGGKFRLIDIPMSNSINSGCLKIFIVTQFLSSSLHQHIFKTYRLGTFSSGFIELLPAEEKPKTRSEDKSRGWFQGPADAVRQNIDYIIDTPVDYFLILSGDQLYNINFQEMISYAKLTDADLVIAALPVNQTDAKRMGILKLDEQNHVIDFYEKPQEKTLLNDLVIPMKTKEPYYLGSMGIYLFKREALLKLLNHDCREDFGKHLIPTKVKQGNVVAYVYEDYWEDIGTIESFYQANMALTEADPKFSWYDENRPIFSTPLNLPGPKIFNTNISSSIICEGSLVEADEVTHSILGPRSIIKKGSIIRDTYVMGNDFYVPPIQTDRIPNELFIGENCIIRKAIIDKHVRIGHGVQLVNKNQLVHFNSEHIYIRDGIIIVTQGASIPDGFIL